MKLSALQFSLGVSVLTHALALSVVSVAIHGRSAKAPTFVPAEAPVLGITFLSEQTVAAAETETPAAASEPKLPVPPAPASVAPASPPARAEPKQPPHAPVPPPPSEPNPQPLACPEESLQATWSFSETPAFPISDLPVAASTAPAGDQQSPSRASVTAQSAGSAPSSVGGPATGAHANYLANPKPVYPNEARRRKQEGLVLLDVTLTTEGLPARVEVSQSSGVALLDDAALSAVKRWRFSPARKDDAAVASQVEVPIHFKLTN